MNAKRPRGDAVPAQLRHAAERCNRYDSELYRYAEQLFEAAPEREQPDFEIELAALHAARTDGDVELEAPAPASYNGDRHSWQLLLHARATLLRVERELAESEVRATTARSRMRGLKQRMEELEAAPARIAELELEVERLEAAIPLKRPAPRTSNRASSKPHRARPKREARRETPKPARARPKPNAKHHRSKPTDAPRAKARRRGTTAKRTRGSDNG